MNRSSHSLAATALGAALASVLAPQASGQGFVEKATAVGLVHEFKTGLDRVGNWAPMCDWIQEGAALGDLDGDVDPDVVAVSRLTRNHVFRNDGGTFADVSSIARIDTTGFDSAVALGDYDRDGDLDLFVGALEFGEGPTQARSRLYRNDDNFVFTNVTAVAGTYGNGHTVHAAFVDLDLDGMLDILTSEFHGTKNHYYRNEGDGSFTEMAAQVGLNTGGSVHVHAFVDVDGDGHLDVFPGTDWKVSNAADLVDNADDLHLKGVGDGTFLDVTAGAAYEKTGVPNFGSTTMGIAVGDVDYDGDFDLYQTQIKDQFLMINNGWPTSGLPWVQAQNAYGVDNFVTATTTVTGVTVGWGAIFFDADLDLWLDLFKANGHVSASNPYEQQNYFWKGLGPAGAFHFSDQSAAFGLNDFTDTRGISVGDVDGDGDLDILTCPPAGMLRYFENQVDRQGRGFVLVRPVCGTSSPGGFGVKASWTDSLGYPHMRLIGGDGTTAGQNEFIAHFGIDLEPAIDLKVEFPSGMTLTFPQTQPDSFVTAVEPVMIELPGRVLPTKASGSSVVTGPSLGGLTALSAEVTQRGFPVVVHAYAQNGTMLGGSAAVTIDIPGLAPIGPVTHVGGNTFRRNFALPSLPGRHRVRVSFNGWQVKVRPTIAFRGEADATRTTTRLTPEAARVGSADTVQVVVTPRDAGGRVVNATSVTVSSGAAIPTTVLTPVGDGSFSGVVSAPATSGGFTITPVVDGVPFGQAAATLDAGGTAVGATSLFYDEVPNKFVALQRHEYKLIVTPRDLFGRRLGPKANVDVVVHPDPGTPTVTRKTDVLPAGRIGGDFLFVLERPVGAEPGSAKGQLRFFVDGALLFIKPYVF